MNLHRAPRPDWEEINPAEYNIWQRIAAKTDGIVTPGNILSASGMVLVSAGVYDIYRGNRNRGLALMALGRIDDLLDGFGADLTATKSPLGAQIDATCDKLAMGVVIPPLVQKGEIPSLPSFLILAQNAANAGMAMQAKKDGLQQEPSKEGKIATFLQWGAIGSYVLEKVLAEKDHKHTALFVKTGANALAACGIALGIKASTGYAKNLSHNKTSRSTY